MSNHEIQKQINVLTLIRYTKLKGRFKFEVNHMHVKRRTTIAFLNVMANKDIKLWSIAPNQKNPKFIIIVHYKLSISKLFYVMPI